eukprot:743897-Hanusia_phi.AAC.1
MITESPASGPRRRARPGSATGPRLPDLLLTRTRIAGWAWPDDHGFGPEPAGTERQLKLEIYRDLQFKLT